MKKYNHVILGFPNLELGEMGESRFTDLTFYLNGGYEIKMASIVGKGIIYILYKEIDNE